MLSVFNCHIAEQAGQYVMDTLTAKRVSEGELVAEFERRCSADFGLLNPVALNSGSSALQLALMLANVGVGDEVICSPQTCVVTALAILMVGATPVFCDVEYETGNLDPEAFKLCITERTKAVIVVHWGGYPADMDRVNVIAKEHGISVVEDAAHAFGAIYKSNPIGTVSDFTCFSFQAIKHLTTGDGGLLCCLAPGAREEAMERRWFGINRKTAKPSELGEREFDITNLGFKFHMNDFSAALGIANMLNLKERIEKRRAIAKFYDDNLKNIDGAVPFLYKDDRQSSYWLYGLHVQNRLNFVRALAAKSIGASVVHQRIDKNSIFEKFRKELPNLSRFDSSQIHIPVHESITWEDAQKIVDCIKSGW